MSISAVLVRDLLFVGRIASAVEIAPVETVVARAALLLAVEEGADISTRLAAIETVSTGDCHGSNQRD